MFSVYKHELVGPMCKLHLVKDAKILKVAEQHGKIVLWELSDHDSDDMEWRTFFMFVTGQKLHLIMERYVFIDTVLMMDGSFVFHVFEEK